MLTGLELCHHERQPYAAVRVHAKKRDIGAVVSPLWPRIAAWLASQHVHPTGPPILLYRVIMDDCEEHGMDLEAGFPISEKIASSGEFVCDELKEGIYLEGLHTGHYSELHVSTGKMFEWAAANNIAFDCEREGSATLWPARMDVYLNDPTVEKDSSKWLTKIAILTKSATAGATAAIAAAEKQ